MTKRISTYRDAGVDIDKTDKMVKKIKNICAKTYRKEVLGKIGNFSAFFKLDLRKYKKPVIVSSTDGVGTKLMVAAARNDYKTIGMDLVAMCVNDLVTCGAEPLFFLDYYASGKVEPEKFYDILSGIVKGCKLSGAALIGGEIAEMPDCYSDGKYDLAGFSVGVVDEDNIIDGTSVKADDVIIGLPSSGLHSNGYSLARKLFSKKEIRESKWGAILAKPTRIYVDIIKKLKDSNVALKAVAHITGGGFYDNIPRVLPDNMYAEINSGTWKIPVLFSEIAKRGTVSRDEMFRTFNMGIGLVVVVDEKNTAKVKKVLDKNKEKYFILGKVKSGKRRVVIN